MTQRMIRAIGISIGVVSFLAGCSTGATDPDAATGPTDTAESITAPPSTEPPAVSAAATVAETTPSTAAPTPPPSAADQGLNPLGGDAPEDFLMPDVLCMNLQEAQDEIQDHGVFYSASEDATGGGRMQLNDSNWQVVAQSPSPGTPIGDGAANLSVVKFGEQPNPC